MKKGLLWILILSVLGGLTWFYKDEIIKRVQKPKTLYEQIVTSETPIEATEVILLNNKILQYYYGETSTQEKLKNIDQVLEKQRALLSVELISQNSKEQHLTQLKKEIEHYKKLKLFMVQTKSEKANIDSANPNYSTVRAVQFFNKNKTFYIQYTLILEDNAWKILKWEKISKFQIAYSKK